MVSRFSHFQFKTALSQLKSGSSYSFLNNVHWGGKPYCIGKIRQFHPSCPLEATHKVSMPSLSPTMTEGTIVKWLKKEGDQIAAGDVLCEIQTDKAVVSLEWDEDAVFAKILMPENSVDVKVGALIALTVDQGDDWQSVEVPSGAGSSASTTAPSPPPSSSEPSAAADIVPAKGVSLVNMPSLSPTMTEGTIVQWLKKEGDSISAGDVLCEIQTDKAVVSLEWDEDAVLAKILSPDGAQDIKVGALIALTVEQGMDWKHVQVPANTGSASSAAAAAPKPASKSSSSTSSASHGSSAQDDRRIGPAVKNYLKKYGLQPSQVKGTGPRGTISKGDVLKHVLSNKLQAVPQDGGPVGGVKEVSTPGGKSASPKPAAAKKGTKGSPASYVEIEVSNMRRTIAKRLLQSKSTIPHAYGTAECNINNMAILRKKLAAEGIKISVNDLIIKCVGNALSRVPAVNCVWEGDQVRQKSVVDISVAVATPNGLITPIVFNVGDRDIIQINEKVKFLAAKARDGKLQPNEFMGGTFSVSNLGMFGVHTFTAIINPPQCAILAVGGNCVAIGEDGKPSTTVKLALSFDASAIEEEQASKFLALLKNEIENTSEISMGIYDLRSRKEILELESVASSN